MMNERHTLIGKICDSCGKAVDDRRVLRMARFMSWKCPHCGAKHPSVNDERAKVHYTISGEDEVPEQEETFESCTIDYMSPEELERRREAFQERLRQEQLDLWKR